MYAKLILVGNLGADPEMRYTPKGTPVVNFSLAVNRSYKNGDGETVKETTWFRITAWNKLAEVINQYLEKGRLVLVEGRLAPQIRVWEGKDGEYRASYEVTAETVKFLGSRGAGSEAAEEAAEEAPAAESEEIPF